MPHLTTAQRPVRCWMRRLRGRAVRATPRTWLVLAPEGTAVLGVVPHPVMLALARKRVLARHGDHLAWDEDRPSRAAAIAALEPRDETR